MTSEELTSLLGKNPLTLLYFSSPDCGVCKVLRPKVEALIAESSPWFFQFVNTEESMEIAGQLLIFAVPTILLMAEGREIERFSRHFGIRELERMVQRYAQLY